MKIQKSFKNNQKSFYILPTPIGNMEDITLRTLRQLEQLDILYCEDTRVTKKILNYYNLKLNLRTYNEFSDIKIMEEILKQLNDNLQIGLVTDAGMPGISDPGYKLIKYLKTNEVNIITYPGASAFILPMVYATVNENPFIFLGFLSKNKTKANQQLDNALKEQKNTIIYESPHKIEKTLLKIYEKNLKCKILIARELTKIYEEYIQGDIKEVLEYVQNNKLKGEIILIITPILEKKEYDYINLVEKKINEEITMKEAVKQIAHEYEISKNELYNNYLKYKEKNERSNNNR